MIKFLPHPNIIDEENVYLGTLGGTSLDAQLKLAKHLLPLKPFMYKDILDMATKLKRPKLSKFLQCLGAEQLQFLNQGKYISRLEWTIYKILGKF